MTFATSGKNDFVLVVGGLGYIGSHTAWQLLKTGQYNIAIIDDLSNSTIRVLRSLQTLRNRWYRRSSFKPHIHFHHADYCDQERMKSILSRYEHAKFTPYIKSTSRSRIIAVFHFAAFKAAEESIQKPLEYYSNNVGGLIEFCKILRQYAVKTIVFSSSATVYGAGRSDSVASARFIEANCSSDGCQSLTTPYSRTKWMSEAILSDLAVSDPSWTIVALRYFNPVGCDESGLLGDEPVGPPTNLMPHVVKAMADESETVRIYGTDWETPDGTAIRDYIHISDLADGHVKALHAIKRKTLRSGYHVFNLGTGTGHSVKEIVSTMEEVSGRKISVSEDDRREGDACACIADASRAASVLNWEPQRSVAKACEDICRRLSLSQWMRRKSSSSGIVRYEKMV